MKKIKISVSIISLILIYSIIKIGTISAQIPQNIYISEGQEFVLADAGIFRGLFSLSSPADHSGIVSLDGKVSDIKDSYSAEVKILDLVTVKKVNVTVVAQEKLIPCGTPIGIKIFSDGLEVIKAESFISQGKSVNPALKANIQKGDVITMANDIPIKKIQDFTKIVNTLKQQELTLTIEGESGTYKAKITPRIDDETKKYKVGLVVRDSMAGVGTLTYFNPSDNTFGALGHGIEDMETGVTFPAKSGSVENVHILSVVKGKKGMPGEIHGMFSKSSLNGSIVKNSNLGIFGTSERCPDGVISQPIPIGYCSDVKEGDAKIICTIEDNNTKEYSVNIEKILTHNTKNSKCMVIKITDRELLNKTGGIIQGMSGSPIIQNGRIVGAVTHVFVNDPTRGYGIFIENMLSEAEKIK